LSKVVDIHPQPANFPAPDLWRRPTRFQEVRGNDGARGRSCKYGRTDRVFKHEMISSSDNLNNGSASCLIYLKPKGHQLRKGKSAVETEEELELYESAAIYATDKPNIDHIMGALHLFAHLTLGLLTLCGQQAVEALQIHCRMGERLRSLRNAG